MVEAREIVEGIPASPQLYPQFLGIKATSIVLGGARRRCKASGICHGKPVTAEVAGSSPVVPAINHLELMVYGLPESDAFQSTVHNGTELLNRTESSQQQLNLPQTRIPLVSGNSLRVEVHCGA